MASSLEIRHLIEVLRAPFFIESRYYNGRFVEFNV
jgi:hypothetical protein